MGVILCYRLTLREYETPAIEITLLEIEHSLNVWFYYRANFSAKIAWGWNYNEGRMVQEQCIVGTLKGLENCHHLHVITCQHVIPKCYYFLSSVEHKRRFCEMSQWFCCPYNGNTMQWCLAPNFLQNIFFCSLWKKKCVRLGTTWRRLKQGRAQTCWPQGSAPPPNPPPPPPPRAHHWKLWFGWTIPSNTGHLLDYSQQNPLWDDFNTSIVSPRRSSITKKITVISSKSFSKSSLKFQMRPSQILIGFVKISVWTENVSSGFS